MLQLVIRFAEVLEKQMVEAGHVQAFEESLAVHIGINLFAQLLHFIVNHLWVGTFCKFDKRYGCSITVIRHVPSGLIEKVTFIDDHVRRSEHRVTEVLNYSDNHIFIDDKIQCLTYFDIMLPRKTFTDNDIPWYFDTFRAAFNKLEIRKHREEIFADSSHFGFNLFIAKHD